MRLELRPVSVRQACDTVALLHRHLPRVIGGLFATTAWVDEVLVGVGIASFPKARMSHDGYTVEISRIATDGHRNACSKLYGALCRASAAIGHRRALTFTRLDEPGTSLRAAGFRDDGVTQEQSWDRPQRSRTATPSQVRRWIRYLDRSRDAHQVAISHWSR